MQNGDIKTVFQPIISLKNGELLGYEALSRGPENSVFNNPEKLFDFLHIFSTDGCFYGDGEFMTGISPKDLFDFILVKASVKYVYKLT